MRLEPLATRVEYPGMVARATVRADEKYGLGSFELVGSGRMAFALVATEDADVMVVRVEDLMINFGQTGMRSESFEVELPAFTIDMCNLDLGRTGGRWYRRDSRIELQLAIVLDPRNLPVMYDLGFTGAVTVVVTEAGRLRWGDEGKLLDTHAEPFRLPEPLDFLTVSPGQFCDVSADFAVSLQCGVGRDLRSTEVWICPGEDACLEWDTSNATSADISTLGSVGLSGDQIVNPTSTTTYVLSADNDCKVKRQVTVRVVRPGETINTLSATYNAWATCMWRVDIPAELVSPSVMVQEMRHVVCTGGGGLFPEWGFRHTDPNGAVITGNVRSADWTDIPDQPLAGVWEFTPLRVDNCRPPEGSAGWEPACFEARLGCR